jgi:hypothetical protein
MTGPYRLALSGILATAVMPVSVHAPSDGTRSPTTAHASGGICAAPSKAADSEAASVAEAPSLTVTAPSPTPAATAPVDPTSGTPRLTVAITATSAETGDLIAGSSQSVGGGGGPTAQAPRPTSDARKASAATGTDGDGKAARAPVGRRSAPAKRGGRVGGPKAGLPLVQKADMVYQGAFRVPRVPSAGGDAGTFNYAEGAIAYNPAHHSLFLVGFIQQDRVGEIGIPQLINSATIDNLKTAPLLQASADIRSRIPRRGGDAERIGGLQMVNGKLVATGYIYYDADGRQQTTHFRVEDPNDLAASAVTGMYRVGTTPPRAAAGYMTEVPADWRADLGATHLTGLAGVPIISTSSFGPAAVGFDAARLGDTVPGMTYAFYRDNQLSRFDTPNRYFTSVTAVRGVVFVPGTRSVLFIGRHGGDADFGERLCYKTAPEGSCPPEIHTGGYASYKVVNGRPVPAYHYRVWAYDALEFVSVRGGAKRPGQLKPYAYWDLDGIPLASLNDTGGGIGGATYDSATGTLYVSALGTDTQQAYTYLPLIHAFKFSMGRP